MSEQTESPMEQLKLRINRQNFKKMQEWLGKFRRNLGLHNDTDMLESKWHALGKTHPRHAEVLAVRFGLQGIPIGNQDGQAKALGIPKGSLGGMVDRALDELRARRVPRQAPVQVPVPVPLEEVVPNFAQTFVKAVRDTDDDDAMHEWAFPRTFRRKTREPPCEASIELELYADGENGRITLAVGDMHSLKLSILAASRLVERLNRAIEQARK